MWNCAARWHVNIQKLLFPFPKPTTIQKTNPGLSASVSKHINFVQVATTSITHFLDHLEMNHEMYELIYDSNHRSLLKQAFLFIKNI